MFLIYRPFFWTEAKNYCVVIQGLDGLQNGYVVVEYFTVADICSGQEASVGAEKLAFIRASFSLVDLTKIKLRGRKPRKKNRQKAQLSSQGVNERKDKSQRVKG